MKICLICSSGGHIIEMQKLKDAFRLYNVFLVTHKDEFLNWSNDIQKVYLIKNVLVGKAHVNRIYKLLLLFAYVLIATTKEFVILLKEKPTVIVSTGSAIAIPIFYMGKVMGKKLIYIESVCRVHDLSIAGKIIYPIADEFFVQWEELTKKYKKVQYKGNVLFKSSEIESNESRKEDFIFVTVGTSPFPRLVKKMDELVGKINERVLIQIGRTQYKPKNAEYFKFTEDFSKIQELCQKAKVVVTHGGAGTIITALEQGAPVIAVPRLKRYGEMIDDHQLEITGELERAEKIIAVYDVDELECALRNVGENLVHLGSERMRLVNALKEYMEELDAKD